MLYTNTELHCSHYLLCDRGGSVSHFLYKEQSNSPIKGILFLNKTQQSQLLEVYTTYTCAIKRTLERIQALKQSKLFCKFKCLPCRLLVCVLIRQNFNVKYQVTRKIHRLKFFVLRTKIKALRSYVIIYSYTISNRFSYFWFTNNKENL